jgi:hypothetical protein
VGGGSSAVTNTKPWLPTLQPKAGAESKSAKAAHFWVSHLGCSILNSRTKAAAVA